MRRETLRSSRREPGCMTVPSAVPVPRPRLWAGWAERRPAAPSPASPIAYLIVIVST
jgi:hypothetical protein